MFKPFIVLQRHFNFSDIEVQILKNQSWKVDIEYDEQVTKYWEEKQRHAAEHNTRIWDGTHYRIANLAETAESKDKINLKLGTVAYRYIATLGDLKDMLVEKSAEAPRHLATAALICTSDRTFLFGKRSYGGKIDLIGGGVQPDEIIVTCGSDLEKNMYKEMEEEAGIRETHIERIEGIGIVHSNTSNVVILCLVHLKVTKKEMEEIFETREDDEMSEPVFVEELDLHPFLSALGTYKPLIPALLKK